MLGSWKGSLFVAALILCACAVAHAQDVTAPLEAAFAQDRAQSFVVAQQAFDEAEAREDFDAMAAIAEWTGWHAADCWTPRVPQDMLGRVATRAERLGRWHEAGTAYWVKVWVLWVLGANAPATSQRRMHHHAGLAFEAWRKAGTTPPQEAQNIRAELDRRHTALTDQGLLTDPADGLRNRIGEEAFRALASSEDAVTEGRDDDAVRFLDQVLDLAERSDDELAASDAA